MFRIKETKKKTQKNNLISQVKKVSQSWFDFFYRGVFLVKVLKFNLSSS